MEDGLLIASNGARIIVNEGASIAGASDVSYIVGEVIHRGTGLKNFPVGTTDAFLPFELIEVTGDSPELGVLAFEGNFNPDIVGTLDDVSRRWSWELSVKSGDFDGSLVRLAVKDENLNGSFDQYVVAEALNLNNPFHSLGQSELSGNIFDGFITSTLRGIAGIYAVGLDLSITEEKPELIIFNAVTPNGDNRHEFLKIENIDFYPQNTVTIYNKTGRKVFEIDGYNNLGRIFSGFSDNNGSEILPNGTYYYYIDKKDGSDPISGYFVLSK
jgi:gliding motility-associated-like protein